MSKFCSLFLLLVIPSLIFAGRGASINCSCGVKGKLYFGAGMKPGTHYGGYCYNCRNFVGYWKESPDKYYLGLVFINNETRRHTFKCPTCTHPVAEMILSDVNGLQCPSCQSDSIKVDVFLWD